MLRTLLLAADSSRSETWARAADGLHGALPLLVGALACAATAWMVFDRKLDRAVRDREAQKVAAPLTLQTWFGSRQVVLRKRATRHHFIFVGMSLIFAYAPLVATAQMGYLWTIVTAGVISGLSSWTVLNAAFDSPLTARLDGAAAPDGLLSAAQERLDRQPPVSDQQERLRSQAQALDSLPRSVVQAAIVQRLHELQANAVITREQCAYAVNRFAKDLRRSNDYSYAVLHFVEHHRASDDIDAVEHFVSLVLSPADT